ncbi:hypothetical protein GCM10023169_28790 [Georgenia halophila]|uniref:DUF559 domain-containing protein n=1 Tax=Georgenia halophila TaxID=620889 RepID=A0ABP8LGS7_9MICO
MAGLLRYGDGAVAVGSSALVLLGAEGTPIRDCSEVMVRDSQPRDPVGRRDPPPHRAQSAVRLSVRQFEAAAPTVRVGRFTVAAPEVALAQAVPELSHRSAIAVMDSMLRKRLIDRHGIDQAHRLARGRRGVARTHPWWKEPDGRAESVLESHGRVECLEHDVPPDDLQVEIRDDRGVVLGRGDLGWRLDDEGWLLVELDGREFHERPAALLHDRSRQNDLVLGGRAHLLRFTARDLANPGHLARTVRRALAQWRKPAA